MQQDGAAECVCPAVQVYIRRMRAPDRLSRMLFVLVKRPFFLQRLLSYLPENTLSVMRVLTLHATRSMSLSGQRLPA